jgi:hypothetical protein
MRPNYYDDSYLWSVNIRPLLSGRFIKIVDRIIRLCPSAVLRRKIRSKAFVFMPQFQTIPVTIASVPRS